MGVSNNHPAGWFGVLIFVVPLEPVHIPTRYERHPRRKTNKIRAADATAKAAYRYHLEAAGKVQEIRQPHVSSGRRPRLPTLSEGDECRRAGEGTTYRDAAAAFMPNGAELLANAVTPCDEGTRH
jgi:hypothetical protein